MRVLGLVAIGMILFSGHALAQSGSGAVFGSYGCSTPVPCVEESNSIPSEQWAAIGNACIAQGFGYAIPTGGFFNDVSGLSASGCLSPIGGSIPKSMGAQLQAHCCVVKRMDSKCVLRCDLLGG